METQQALRKTNRTLYLGVCAGILLLAGALCVLTRPAADDFYYATFCAGGLGGYLRASWLHYRTVTGRVLVHLVLCPLLQFHMWPFRLFNFLLIGGLCWLCACLCARRTAQRLPLFAAGLCMFFLMGVETLSDGVLWGAGSLNYLFPVFLVLLYYGAFRRCLPRPAGGWLLAVPAFLCSATVEMTGLLTPLVIVCAAAVHPELRRSRRDFILLNLGSALLGYLSLFTSPGVARRLEQTHADITLLQRVNANFALFDRKACGPEGIWAVVLLCLLGAGVLLWQCGRRPAAALLALPALGVVLTGTGAVSGGIPVAGLALCAFLALLGYGVWSFRAGERLVPLCMLCTTVSLSICLVSPVVEPRMMLPSAVFLTAMALRTFALCRLPGRAAALSVSALGLAAGAVLCVYLVHFTANARVIDGNDRTARTLDGGPVLELSHVPDERFGGLTVPAPMNFGGYYLETVGRPGLEFRLTDPTARPVFCAGRDLGESALLRSGQYYVPIRIAAPLLGAQVRWELTRAVVTTAEGTYCFHRGDCAAGRGLGVGPSVRLHDPVRLIDSTTYISIRDFEALFHVALSV